jgi:predicted metal-dependent HD superfamily phosphohydrolase
MNDVHWLEVWRALGAEVPPSDLLQRLMAAWREPQRHYHTLQHLDECLMWLEHERDAAERPAEIALALWFHDAVYDVHAHDNESRSADWAHREMLAAGVGAQSAERVHALVMATKHDTLPQGRDAELLVDIDLAILGAARERFDEYERQVRAEYIHVPDAQFRPRRRGLLQRFLERDALYATPRMRALLEQPARANLARSIASIG